MQTIMTKRMALSVFLRICLRSLLTLALVRTGIVEDAMADATAMGTLVSTLSSPLKSPHNSSIFMLSYFFQAIRCLKMPWSMMPLRLYTAVLKMTGRIVPIRSP